MPILRLTNKNLGDILFISQQANYGALNGQQFTRITLGNNSLSVSSSNVEDSNKRELEIWSDVDEEVTFNVYANALSNIISATIKTPKYYDAEGNYIQIEYTEINGHNCLLWQSRDGLNEKSLECHATENPDLNEIIDITDNNDTAALNATNLKLLIDAIPEHFKSNFEYGLIKNENGHATFTFQQGGGLKRLTLNSLITDEFALGINSGGFKKIESVIYDSTGEVKLLQVANRLVIQTSNATHSVLLTNEILGFQDTEQDIATQLQAFVISKVNFFINYKEVCDPTKATNNDVAKLFTVNGSLYFVSFINNAHNSAALKLLQQQTGPDIEITFNIQDFSQIKSSMFNKLIILQLVESHGQYKLYFLAQIDDANPLVIDCSVDPLDPERISQNHLTRQCQLNQQAPPNENQDDMFGFLDEEDK